MAGLRRISRRETERPARASASGQLSSSASQKDIHPEGGRQQAVVHVLEAIYEEDFLGFSYGFRPGRGQHDALDALHAGIYRKQVNWVLDADIQGFLDPVSYCPLVHEVLSNNSL